MLKSKLLSATAAAPEPVFIEDVFSTWLYTGNGSAQVIQNGINLGQSFGSGSAEFSNYLDTSPIALNTQITFTGDFTAEAFILVRDHHSSGTCWLGSSWPTYNNQLYITSTGYLAAYNESPTTNTVASSQQMSVGKFYHVAVTRSSGTIYLWVNGVSAGSGTHGGTFRFTTIGALGGYSGAAVDGFISNLRVSNNARYTSAFTPPTSALSVDGNTILLALQSDNLFTDKVGTYTLTKSSSVTASNFGPFDAAEAGEGGLVWVKQRTSLQSHYLFDTERGAGFGLRTNSTSGEYNYTTYNQSFNIDGFSFATSDGALNGVGDTYASWTFRKAARFFDVVTYTGNGAASQTINHNLGTTVGCIIVKRTDANGWGWRIFHRQLNGGVNPEDYKLQFDTSPESLDNGEEWGDTAPTSTTFTVGNGGTVNANGGTYVAYLFAHDPLGPSGDGSDGLIACGSYTGNGSADGPEITLGWEPQWLLIKNATTGSYSWTMLDTMRGIVTGGDDQFFRAETSDAEATFGMLHVTATGFKLDTTNGSTNRSGDTFIYIAIRRGPMRAPESGTEVFKPLKRNELSTEIMPTNTGFATDLVVHKPRISSANPWFFASRLQGDDIALSSNNSNAEANYSGIIGDGFWKFDSNDGAYIGAGGYYNNNNGFGEPNVSYSFRRAPGFFDVVAYTGTSTSTVYPHNLNAVPELVIIKNRTGVTNWKVWHKDFGTTYELNLNSSNAVGGQGWINTLPTSENITIGVAGIETNTSGYNYIAYLFATLPGISKVGSYTGTGASDQTINCGFTSGARFVLIKRTDSTSNWRVWDTARGIVVGNDASLDLNNTSAESTGFDQIDPDSSGFKVKANDFWNTSGANFIFLAIA